MLFLFLKLWKNRILPLGFLLVLSGPGSLSIGMAQGFGTGCTLDPALYRKAPLAPMLSRGEYEKLPERVSLRKYAPEPQNQGAYGTCVGWSTAYAARTILMAIHQKWDNQTWITENALSPFFIYEQAKPADDIYCQVGTSLYSALEIIKEKGTVRIREFSGQCGQPITPQHSQKASKFRIKEYRRLFEEGQANKLLAVKKALAENRPVVIGMQCCTESFLEAKGIDYWQRPPGEEPPLNGGHALTVIGYDDQKNGGAIELMNSWGTAWGEDGFIWISYQDFEKYCFEAYEMYIEQAEETPLAGSLRFRLANGTDMASFLKETPNGAYYEMLKPYHSGTLFRLYVQNTQPAYVYAFSSDLTGKCYRIFPHREGISGLLPYRENQVAIPDDYLYLQLDNQEGIDFFCVLYSHEPLDFSRLLQKLDTMPGILPQKLPQALGTVHPSLPLATQVHYDEKGKIAFQAPASENQIIPLIVAIRHLK